MPVDINPKGVGPYDSVYSPSGWFPAYPGAGKSVLIDPDEAKVKGYWGRITVPDGATRPIKRAWSILKENLGLVERPARGPPEIPPPRAGGHPFYETGTDDLIVSAAYSLLMNDVERKGYAIMERSLDDLHNKGQRMFGYAIDGLEYDNVIEIGSALPNSKKLEVLSHEYAAKKLRLAGKTHEHYRNSHGGFKDDEFFSAGREVEKEYLSRAIASLFNQN